MLDLRIVGVIMDTDEKHLKLLVRSKIVFKFTCAASLLCLTSLGRLATGLFNVFGRTVLSTGRGYVIDTGHQILGIATAYKMFRVFKNVSFCGDEQFYFYCVLE